MRLPPMNALRAFEAAARHCSFKRAGEELHVSAGAISRFVKLLEDDLQVQLFERLPSGLRLTEPGRALLPKLSRAFGAIEAATREASGSQRKINIVLPGTLGSRLMIAKIADYNAADHGPKVHYSLEFNGWDSFFNGDFDIGVCCVTGAGSNERPPRLEFRFLRPEALTPLCAPALAEGTAPLRRPEDLARFDLLHPYIDKQDWRKWLDAAGVGSVDPDSGQTFMTMELAIRAAVQGYGVAMGDLTLLQDELRSGELVAPFDFVLTEDTGYLLFGKPERLAEPHIAAFCDWLMQAAGTPSIGAEEMKPARLASVR